MERVKRYYRKARALPYNPFNRDAKAGDVMIGLGGELFTLYEITRGPASQSNVIGELSARLVKPPSPDMCAAIIDGEAWWVKKEKVK